MNQYAERVASLAERLGACAALAAGGSLIFSFANQLAFGPLIPQIVGALLAGVGGGVASLACIDFVSNLPVRNKFTLLLACMLGGLLSLVATYFIGAAIFAAKASIAS